MQKYQIRPLAITDVDALVGFETENRAFFEKWVPPRKPAYFDAALLTPVLEDLLSGESAETAKFYAAFDNSNNLVGRINMSKIQRDVKNAATASVGYRVAEAFAGLGVANAALTFLCVEAKILHGLDQLTAQAMVKNKGSTQVLLKNGFELMPNDNEIVELNGNQVELLRYSRLL